MKNFEKSLQNLCLSQEKEIYEIKNEVMVFQTKKNFKSFDLEKTKA